MTDENQNGLTLLLANLAETIADHSVPFTLITAALASTAILSIGNGLFSHVRALKAVSSARTWDDVWPVGSVSNIASELSADITYTEKMIVILCGLGLANVAALVGLFAIGVSGYTLYIFQCISLRMIQGKALWRS